MNNKMSGLYLKLCMTREELFKAQLNQMWTSGSALVKKMIIAIPVGVIVLVVIWCIIKLVEKKCSTDNKVARILVERKGWILGLGFYIALLIQMGVLSRPFGSARMIHWVPFHIPGGGYLVAVYVAANALIFIPFGILVPKVFRGVNTLWKMILITFITSVCIEVIQYVFACGYSEVEDVIMNVVGAVIGYLIIRKIDNDEKQFLEN